MQKRFSELLSHHPEITGFDPAAGRRMVTRILILIGWVLAGRIGVAEARASAFSRVLPHYSGSHSFSDRQPLPFPLRIGSSQNNPGFLTTDDRHEHGHRRRWPPSSSRASSPKIALRPDSPPGDDDPKTPLGYVKRNEVPMNGIVKESWAQNFSSNTIPSIDYVNAMVVDSAGDVYVTGYSEATISGGDYLTIKYNQFGDTIWTRRYDGGGNDYDEPTGIAIDSRGNVVVTGYSYNPHGDADYLTLKYDSGGIFLWAHQYGGSADSSDVATGLAVDADGNVYVIGYSYDGPNDFDFLTIKYTADGIAEWVRRFDGGAHGADVPIAVAAGPTGQISLTGYMSGVDDGFDAVTVAYLPDGTEAWHDSYNGPSNLDDLSTSIVIDPAGNTFVAGYSFTAGEHHDYLTMKYDATGSRRWEAKYNGVVNGDDRATALTLDQAGNIIVSGLSSVSGRMFDCITIKYNTDGQELWRRVFSSAPGKNSIPTSAVVDRSSNIVITGYVDNISAGTSNFLAVAYDSSGIELWSKSAQSQPNQNAIGIEAGVDAAGNVYLAGTDVGQGVQDFLTVRFDAARLPLWPVRLDATGNGSEKLTSTAVDVKGNVYVTGFGYRNGGSGYGLITVKYDQEGRQQWVVMLDSMTTDFYTPQLFVDSRMNVYVTSLNYYYTAYHSSYVTVKYDSNGIRKWLAVHGSFQQSEIKGIVADAAGSVYIAGTNFYTRQIILIKYDAAGRFLWATYQNGRCAGLSIDSMGSILLTGSVDGFGTRADFVTTKCNSNGDILWTSFYDSPNSGIDGATAMTIDAGGNVYVAGSSYTSENGYQFAIVKYDPHGNQMWAEIFPDSGRSYTYPAAIAVSISGNVYLTGRALSSNDYLTIGYNSTGVELWSSLYNGPGLGADVPVSVTVSRSGFVYVTGTSLGIKNNEDFATIKYDAMGAVQWVARYESPRRGIDFAQQVMFDARGHVYVAGTSMGDYLVVMYDTTGKGFIEPDVHWPSRYDGPGLSNDFASAVKTDPAGNVVMVGGTTMSNGFADFVVAEYDAAGASSAVNTYAGYGFNAEAVALAIDRAGNRYVTGDVARQSGTLDIATLKYDARGIRQWISLYDGPANDYDFAQAIAVDDSSNVYVAGYGVRQGSGYDIIVMKYGTDGWPKWEARYNGPGNGDDLVAALAVDVAGNVYASGLSSGLGTLNDFATIKYDPMGHEKWVARYNGAGNDDDRPAGIALDSFGNLYVAGSSKGGAGHYDFVTVKYDSNGREVWTASYDGTGQADDLARAVGVDRSGDIVVTGASYGGVSSRSDFTTLKYDRDGRLMWVQRYNGPGNGDDEPRALSTDSGGNVYVTGKSIGTDHSYDFETIRYTPNGILEWDARYSAAIHVNDVPSAMTIDKNGDVCVTGNSSSSSWSMISTVKYSQVVLEVPEPPIGHPTSFRLYENYPNPFNALTNIDFDLPRPSNVNLKIYDVLGRELLTVVEGGLLPSGHHSIRCNFGELATGVYFYRLAAEPMAGNNVDDRRASFESTHKMVYVK